MARDSTSLTCKEVVELVTELPRRFDEPRRSRSARAAFARLPPLYPPRRPSEGDAWARRASSNGCSTGPRQPRPHRTVPQVEPEVIVI